MPLRGWLPNTIIDVGHRIAELGDSIARARNWLPPEEQLLPERAMSEENVERIRRASDALNRRRPGPEDFHRVATALLHPDVEWCDQRELPGATVHHGIEGVERHAAASQESLDYDATDLIELIDADPCVVAVYRLYARGRSSGVPVACDAVWVYRFRGELVERVEIFGTRHEALEATGLSDKVTHPAPVRSPDGRVSAHTNNRRWRTRSSPSARAGAGAGKGEKGEPYPREGLQVGGAPSRSAGPASRECSSLEAAGLSE
jgi:ketosteroid isomerase-like protein